MGVLQVVPYAEIYLTEEDERHIEPVSADEEGPVHRQVRLNGVLVRLNDDIVPDDDGIVRGRAMISLEDNHLLVDVWRVRTGPSDSWSEIRCIQGDERLDTNRLDTGFCIQYGLDAEGSTVVVI